MRAADLGSLVVGAGALGPFDLVAFKTVFELHDPDLVHEWAEGAIADLRKVRKLSLDDLLAALEDIGPEGPNAVTASVIADRVGQMASKTPPTRQEVRDVVRGLAVLVPSLVRITGDDVFLSTSPKKLREAILSQISKIPAEYRLGIDEELATEGDG
jgi:hypothetical protein